MRPEVVELWDQLTGTGTTDLKTFQAGIFLAFKE